MASAQLSSAVTPAPADSGRALDSGDRDAAPRPGGAALEARDRALPLTHVSVPQLGVTVDLWGMSHHGESLTTAQTMVAIGPREWLLPQLWLRGGVGVVRTAYNYQGAHAVSDLDMRELASWSEWAPSAMAAAGLELVASRGLLWRIELRAGTGFLNRGDDPLRYLSLRLGASWY